MVTKTVRALQWQKTDTWLNQDATDSLDDALENPNANYMYIDARVTVSGSTASAYITDEAEYQGALDKLTTAEYEKMVRVRFTNQNTLNPADKTTFFSTAQTAIVYWASMAETYGATHFVLATEMTLLEMETYSSNWNTIITAVRAVFSGEVGYETNYWYSTALLAQKTGASWFANLDFLAVSCYFDLASTTSDTIGELIAAWSDFFWYHANILDDLTALYTAHSAPIFLVTGCASQDGAAMHPWQFTFDTEIIDVDEQNRWFSAFFQATIGLDFVTGYMIDGAVFTQADKDPNNNEFTIVNKPAFDTVTTYFEVPSVEAPPAEAPIVATRSGRLRTIISKLEQRQPTSIYEPHVYEPGIWRNGNGMVDKIVNELEKH